VTHLKERENTMDQEQEDAQPQPTRSPRQWFQLLLPEARMRVATWRMPRDWFEFLTRIPIIERMVIKRFVENLMCDQWLKQPHSDLDGREPASAATEAEGRALLESLLTRMARNREKTQREMRRIRRQLKM
jgi:DNA-binding TFAR19-related protein (PDSD5 family)